MRKLAAIGAAALFAAAVFIFALIQDHDGPPIHYASDKKTAANGVVVYMLQTSPDHIQLQAIDTNVTRTGYVGINGGFFWEGALLSIAVINDLPLKGARGDYGSGWYNTGVNMNLKRGTLVWDEPLQRFSVQVVTTADELKVSDKSRYWAQGGVSMGLTDEAGWRQHMIDEEMPAYDEGHMRTGLAYDRNNQLYLIVTPTECTVEQFREAIRETLGPRGIVDGVFLDGDGSSQLRAGRLRLSGDGRQVYQMLRIVR